VKYCLKTVWWLGKIYRIRGEGVNTLKLNEEERKEECDINPLMSELNPSAQLCLTRFFTGDFAALEPYISLTYA
jgi:hypothetical protein